MASLTLLPSASRTTTQTSPDLLNIPNYFAKGIRVVTNMTNVGTGSITVSIKTRSGSGVYTTLLAGTAITTNIAQTLEVYPGIAVAANASASSNIGEVFQILVTANNANAATYSVDYELLP